jgi:hypothetical protein
MSDGTISGNTASYYNGNGVGGGVSVADGAFTMGGGTISGNTASYGGGVYIDNGTFTMNSGTISGNMAGGGGYSGNGGGVYVEGGEFWLNGGTVYGKGAGTGLANTASSGASLALSHASITAKYGNFDDIIESGAATDATLVGHN